MEEHKIKVTLEAITKQFDKKMDSMKKKLGEMMDTKSTISPKVKVSPQEYNKVVNQYKKMLNDLPAIEAKIKATPQKVDSAAYKELANQQKEYTKQLEIAEKEQAKLFNPDGSNAAQEMNSAKAELSSLEERLRVLKQTLHGLMDGGSPINTAQFRGIQKEATETNTRMVELKKKILDLGPSADAFNKASEKVANYRYELQRTERAMDEMVLNNTDKVDNPAWVQASNKAMQLRKAIAETRRELEQMEVSTIAPKKATSGFNEFYKMLKKIVPWLTLGKVKMNDFSQGMRSTYGTGGPLSRMFRTLAISARFMIASMVFTGAINSVKAGFTDLYNYGGRTAKTLLQLKNNLLGLRGSFATAFAPILNYVAPVLNYLISLLTTAMNAIARFFAVLTGQKTYEVSAPGTKGFNDAAGAAGDATDAAEKYKKTILGFDQINKLDEQPSSGGGGGGGGGGTTDATIGLVDNASSKFAEMVKEAWANDGDFEEVGRYVGEKLELALESIPWERIQAKCEKIGKSIATFINGFVETPGLFDEIGVTVGEALNTVLSGIDGFVTNLHWDSIGKGIGDAITGAFRTIDADKLSNVLAGIINGVPELVANTITTTNWGVIADKIQETLEKTIAKINILDLIKNLFKIDSGIVNAAFNLGDGLGDGLINGLLDSLGLDSLKGKFDGWVENVLVQIFPPLGWFKKGSELGSQLTEGLKDGVTNPNGDPISWWEWILIAFKTFFGIASPSKVMKTQGGYLIEGLKEGLNDKMDEIKAWFKNLPNMIKEWLGGKVEIGVGLIKSGWSSLKEWVGTKVSVGIGLFKSGWSTVSKFVGTKVSVGLKLVKNGWSTVKKWMGSNLTQKLGFKLPKIGVKWGSKTVLGFKISFPKGFYTYAKGGFPEEGPFMMNRGEIAGKFSNGKGVVANNQQITTGIANAVGPAVYEAQMRANRDSSMSNKNVVILEGDAKQLFRVIQKEANDYMQTTGQLAFNL